MIDLLHIAKSVWHRLWVVILAGIIAAAIGFSVSAFIVKPQYESSVMLYVNSSSVNVGGTSFSITSSEIVAAQSLTKTYTVLLKNRTTLEAVIEKADVAYSYEELYDMISAGSVNNTEVLKVSVVCGDPYEAAKIANCIAEVLPQRISVIIKGATMEVVDAGVPNLKKISPSITKYTAIGLILGAVISILVLAVLAVMDNTIHGEDYILSTYNFPILAKVPDVAEEEHDKYGYYAKYGYGAAPRKNTKGGGN